MTTVLAAEPDVRGHLTTDVVTDVADFVRLEAEWNDMVTRSGVTHPFLRHEWFRTWWDCFGAGRQLHIVVTRCGREIVAIAPLMFEQVQMYGVPARKLDFLHNDHTPRADLIVAPATASLAYHTIWDHVRAMSDQWDVWQLSRLPRTSRTLDALTSLVEPDRCLTGTWNGDVSPLLTLRGTWDSYYASLPAEFRSNLRNRLSRLVRFGEPRLEILDGRHAIERACQDVERLEASGWKRESGSSIGSSPAVRRFYELLAARAAQCGWLRVMFLTVGDRRIAASYGACFDRRLFLFKTGYDPDYASCSPFKLLTYFAIQRAYAERLVEIDFLGDAEPWKLEWTDTSQPQDWLFVFANTARARLLHSIKFHVVPALRRWRA